MAGLYTGTRMLFSLSFFSFLSGTVRRSLKGQHFIYPFIGCENRYGVLTLPSRECFAQSQLCFLFQTNFKWRELLMSCTLTFRPWCSFNSCIRSLCIYLQHSPPWQESYLAPLSHQASLRGLLRQS